MKQLLIARRLYFVRFAFSFVVVCLSGCDFQGSRPQIPQTSLRPVEPTDEQKSVSHLLATPVDLQLTIPVAGADHSYSVPTAEELACDGRTTTLHVSHSTGTVWITRTGGIGDHIRETVGPWPASNPDVQLIVASTAELRPNLPADFNAH